MSSAAVGEIYKNYGILADAKEKAGEFTAAFEGILAAAKGSSGEKRLAAQFIPKFFNCFPDLSDQSMDALFDLVEDEDPLIRRTAIKSMPDICKGSSDQSLSTKVADVLTQLLLSEDATDLGLVKTTMATVLQMDTKGALQGIFDQIMGGDEAVREKGIDYLRTSLMDMRHKLFIPNKENEVFLVEQIKKVLVDVTEDEFETFIEVLGKVSYLATPQGAQQIVDIISEQADLQSEFQPENTESVDRFTICFRIALRFCKQGGSSLAFVQYVCVRMLPVLSAIADEKSKHEVLQLLAEGSMYLLANDDTSECLTYLYSFLLEQMPKSPEGENTSEPKLQFAVVECVLFTFHQMIQQSPDFLNAESNAERLKEFRQRLQYFARGCQSWHAQLQSVLKNKTALQLKEEENKLRQLALKTTANISSLIKDFFHNPPSYKTTVQLSWGVKKSQRPTVVGGKRPVPEQSGSEPAKRKPSPIRFESKGGGDTTKDGRKQPRQVYEPPRNQFSKSLSNGTFQELESQGTSRGSGRGRSGRGRGNRRRGGRWNKY